MKGQYFHTIDAKGRMIIPVKLREDLGEDFTVTKGLDGCLSIYPKKEWDILEEKIRALPMIKSREMIRFFCSNAVECSLDAQGRILISQNLRNYAELSKNVTVIGVLDHAEIWDSDKFEAYSNNITMEKIEKTMEEIGF